MEEFNIGDEVSVLFADHKGNQYTKDGIIEELETHWAEVRFNDDVEQVGYHQMSKVEK